MSAPREDPGYAKLLLLVGEISGDVKNLLTRSAEHTERLNRSEDRQGHVNEETERRLQLLEKTRGKLLGIAWAIPVALAVIGLAVERWYHG